MWVFRKQLIGFLLAINLLSFFTLSRPGFSAVFNVTDSAELQTALTTAQGNGANDTINLAAGPYLTNGTTFTYIAAVGENFDLILDGAGLGLTILDGDSSNMDQVLRIITTGVMPNDSAVDITIRDLTIRNGVGVVGTDGDGGGLRLTGALANLTVQNSAFTMNTTNGLGGGLYAMTMGNVTLSNVMFTGNSSSASDGGGAFIQNAAQVNVANSNFTNNTANSDGGGLALMNVMVSIDLTGNSFSGNDATNGDGGAVANMGTGIPQNDLDLMGNTFMDNTAGDDGGGLFSSTAGNVTLEDDTFDENSAADTVAADRDGGGAFIQNSELLMITGGTFTDNSATSDGGGLLALNVENLNLADSTFDSNTAINGHGGGLAGLVTGMLLNSASLTGNTFADNTAGGAGGGAAVMANGDLEAEDNAFTGNSSVGNGGGLHAEAEGVALYANEFDENTTEADGGGAAVTAGGDLDAMQNAFTDNSAEGEGGGLSTDAEDATLNANEFDGNVASAYGGGLHATLTENAILTNNIFINNSSEVNGGGADITADDANLTNNTLTLNSTGGDGGGVNLNINDSTSANIYNNIVFNNSATGDGLDIYLNDDVNANLMGSTVNLFNNDFSDFFSVCENALNCVPNINRGSNINTNPLFVNAAGGDVSLMSNSPAIDLGDPAAPDLPATDFAGNPRTVGPAPDMGALEFSGASSINVTIVKSSDLTEVTEGKRVDITYTIILENTGTQSATGIMVEEPLPEGATLVVASQGCLADALGTVTCNVGTLGTTGPDKTKNLIITINIKPRGKEIINQAILSFLGAGGVTVEKDSNSVFIRIKEAPKGCSLAMGPVKFETTVTDMIVLLIPGLVFGVRAIRRKRRV